MFLVRQALLPLLFAVISAVVALGWQSYSELSDIRTIIIGFAVFCVFMVLLNHANIVIQSSLMSRKLSAIFGLEDNLLRRIQEIETHHPQSAVIEDLQQRIARLEEIVATGSVKGKNPLAEDGTPFLSDSPDDNVIILKPKTVSIDGNAKKPSSSNRVYKPTLDNLLAEEAVSIKMQPIINLMSKDIMAVEAFPFLETKNGTQSIEEVIKSFSDEQKSLLDLIVVKRLSTLARKMEIDGQLLPIHYSFASLGVAKHPKWTKICNIIKADNKLAVNFVPQVTMAQYRRFGDTEAARFLEFKEFGSRPCLTACEGINTIIQVVKKQRINLLKLTVKELLSYTHKEGERVADVLLPQLSKLGVETIANNVEKAHQAANLIDLDISLAQGLFISPARSVKFGPQADDNANLADTSN